MNKKITSKYNVIILIIISFLVLYFALKDDFNSIVNNIIGINIFWFLIAILLVFGYWLFRSIAYQEIITKFDSKYNFWRSFGLMMLTQFFNGITPSASGGQPLVVYTLKKDGIKATDGTNIVVMDFITFQIALVLLGTVAVIYNHFFHIFEETYLLKELVTIGYIINLTIVALLFLVSFARRFNHFVIKMIIKLLTKMRLVKYKERVLNKWEERINNFHDGALILFKDRTLFIRLIGINMLGLIAVYLVPMALLYSFKDYSSYNGIEAIVSSAYINLVGALVPSPGSTGALEFAFIAFFKNFIKGSILSSLMLLWRFITYYFGLTIGAIVFNVWKRRD